jgi:hypothetical protein
MTVGWERVGAGRHEERGGDGHGYMARGGYGLPKFSPGPAMPYPSTPCSEPPLKRPHGRAGSLWPSSVPLDTPRRMLIVYYYSLIEFLYFREPQTALCGFHRP